MALENWNIDTVHSTVGFTVRHLMVSKVHGLFTKWKGTFAFDEANLATSHVEVNDRSPRASIRANLSATRTSAAETSSKRRSSRS